MKCVILQPSYIPWRGYFHLIQKADLFIFYDDVQYDKSSWRNRNRINTASGNIWLTIPVNSRGIMQNKTPINEIKINETEDWAKKHKESIRFAYAKAPFFKQYFPLIEDFYRTPTTLLADFTIETTLRLANELGITNTKFMRSSSLKVEGQKTARLISILKKVGATHYISGPTAKSYIEEEKFKAEGITLEYMVYDYPEYPQLHAHKNFEVSVIDLLLMTGQDAPSYIWKDNV